MSLFLTKLLQRNPHMCYLLSEFLVAPYCIMICLPHKPSCIPPPLHWNCCPYDNRLSNKQIQWTLSVIILLDLFVAFRTVDLMTHHWALLAVVLLCSCCFVLPTIPFQSPFSKDFSPPTLLPKGFILGPQRTRCILLPFIQIFIYKYIHSHIWYCIRHHGKQQRWARKPTFFKSSRPNVQDR